MPASEIRGRADNFRVIFDQVWDRLWPLLSNAGTDQEVIDAFLAGAVPYAQEFVPHLANLIYRVLHERRFPKRRQAQVNFLADSLGGWGLVAPRSSRDICERDRLREERTTYIIRYEVYVECSCGFKGRSKNLACRKCSAKINFGFAPLHGVF
jgi:hypothetical protein